MRTTKLNSKRKMCESCVKGHATRCVDPNCTCVCKGLAEGHYIFIHPDPCAPEHAVRGTVVGGNGQL